MKKPAHTHVVRTDIDSLRAAGAPLVLAYGLGVDSTAVLVGLHQRGIRPDAILFADTGSEHPSTYSYLPVINCWLRSVGFPEVTVVRYVPKRFKFAPYSTLEGNCLSNSTLPSLAFGRKSCSLKWKRAPQDKWTAKWAPARSAWAKGLPLIKMLGYDAGPADSKRGWNVTDEEKYTYWYPLRDWGWDRAECQRQIAAADLPVPRKSSCFFCPAMKEHEVLDLVENWPELADRIVEIERRAAPGLRTVQGLWRRATKTRPGSMSEFIAAARAKRALPVLQPTLSAACAECLGL